MPLLASLSLLILAPSSPAAGLANVTVRVEGATHTLLEPTQVTTNTTSFSKDGNAEHSCTGTSAAGALQLATGGNWSGTWFSGLGYSAETIEGETHAFEEGAPANYYWGFWVNDKSSESGICGTELESGAEVLLFPECFSESEACPAPSQPLAIEVPASAEAGMPTSVTVKAFDSAGVGTPAAGATIAASDGVSATTDANGHATLSFPGAGSVKLAVSRTNPPSVRTEATVCVHAGNDGTCGTPGTSGSPSPSTPSNTAYVGPFAVVAKAIGLTEHHVYAHGHGPRVLSGTVAAHAPVTSVSLELRRSYQGHCSYYDGTRERFVAARCGKGSEFKVANGPSFSYLLPSGLGPGRYVFDIHASDDAGHQTTLSRGSSRLVFYVK